MKTATIQIGNTDNKLTQQEWAEFCKTVEATIQKHDCAVHFYGFPPGDAKWQNAAWVIAVPFGALTSLRFHLAGIAGEYRQESIAVTIGETVFVN